MHSIKVKRTYHRFIHSGLCFLVSHTSEDFFAPSRHSFKLPFYECQKEHKFRRRRGPANFPSIFCNALTYRAWHQRLSYWEEFHWLQQRVGHKEEEYKVYRHFSKTLVAWGPNEGHDCCSSTFNIVIQIFQKARGPYIFNGDTAITDYFSLQICNN